MNVLVIFSNIDQDTVVLIFSIIIGLILLIGFMFSRINKEEIPKSSNLVNYDFSDPFDRKVYSLLKSSILYGIHGLNLLLKKNDYTTQIDNILITTKAVYCLECKDYSGNIRIYEHGDIWYQELSYWKKVYRGSSFQKDTFHIYNPLKQNQSHINFLKNNIKLNNLPIINIIVFSDKSNLINDITKSDHTHIISYDRLIQFIKAYELVLKAKISVQELNEIRSQLIAFDHFTPENFSDHIKKIQNRIN
jgi:hypothetical protein